MVLARPDGLENASRVILPGVGSFGHGMQQLRERGFEGPLRDRVVKAGIPLLGICLGMQFLTTRGWEGGATEGLNLIPGDVRRFSPSDSSIRIPHIGWNDVYVAHPSPLFDGIPEGSDFYFVHSYHVTDCEECNVLARTDYCGGFVSAIAKDLVFGVQFHPEKSQQLGFRLLRNFLAI